MLIAIPYKKGNIEPDFDAAFAFKFYEVEGEQVIRAYLLGAEEGDWHTRTDLLREVGADTLICGAMGFDARMELRSAGVRIYSGKQGRAEKYVSELLDGLLFYYSAGMCTGGCD